MNLELELQRLKCLCLAVSGSNGKSTTAGLLERMLRHNQRRAEAAGPEVSSVAGLADRSAELDYAIVQLEGSQLPSLHFFRPAVAVLLNVAPSPSPSLAAAREQLAVYAGLIGHQQFFDWAVIQHETLVKLRELKAPLPSRIISFSAWDPAADLGVSRGLLISRLAGWAGPLLDLDHCLLRGPHNAENLLAALAVGHLLRLPLEGMSDALKTFHPGPHRCELIAEINGVQFVNDSKAANLDAMESALRAARPGPQGEPNIWLIAGGADEGQDYHSAGPLLAKRVKHVFLLGRTSQNVRSAWSLFTPCKAAGSLLEAVAEAAKQAASGDVVLLSPACSGLDQFRNHQHRGQVFCEAVKSIGRGSTGAHPPYTRCTGARLAMSRADH